MPVARVLTVCKTLRILLAKLVLEKKVKFSPVAILVHAAIRRHYIATTVDAGTTIKIVANQFIK